MSWVSSLPKFSGLTFAIGNWSYLTLAGALPLKSYPNRGFDAETGIQYVRRY